MSAKHEWLNLLEVSGPFLAVPVLREVFPQGLEELDSSRAKRLRSAYEEWRDAVDGDDADRDKLHAAWIDEVLRTALEADDQLLKAGKDVPASLVELPEHDTAIAPEFVFVDPTHGAAVLAPVHVFPPDTDLSASMKFGGLSCSAGDRMALHLRALNVPFGIVTNGERWMLVHAPTGEVATFSSWYARIWGQEPATLRAFTSLLGVRRFFAPAQDRLPALFERSLKHQDEVTDALGDQVRRAIEVLVQALDRADQDRNRELLRDVKPQELYEAGLTVMMRLVFLLAAEERGLLLLGEPRYDSFYAVSTLRMQLRAESDEILERRRASWSRLLAVFRAVFGGIDHPTLRLPAMGGSLFDPDRFPFLEGRLKGTSWRQHRAEPLPIDDRTVLLLLEAIQTFEGRTLSYRALDVEQIGHVYEGLLERTVSRVEDVTLELEAGAQAKDARVTLGELESARLDGQAAVTSLLVERSKRSESATKNALGAEVEPQQDARLLSACRGDVKLRDRLAPYVRLMRTDPWGYPLVHPKGAFVVVLGADRRETGTHYTPKSLTERIVEETLTPLVYDGPAKGAPRAEWKLHTPEQLLDLKVCDPAMGSGAFLVQACRFLSARLVEAWAIEEAAGRVVDLTGQVHEPRTSVESMPPGVEARAENARRIVAERCLYGVDLNPQAVELAKLSLWLVTLSKGRPFGFLDHNLRRGDSLLGISRLEQLTELALDPAATRQGRLFGRAIERAVTEAVELRRKLYEIPIRDIRDVAAMATLDADARKKLEAAELLADAFIGLVFAADGADVETRLAALAADADRVVTGEARASETIQARATKDLAKDAVDGMPRRPLHWPLEFPEVFRCGGFDSIVGNPPFLNAISNITGRSEQQRNVYAKTYPLFAQGSYDLSLMFWARALCHLLKQSGRYGMLSPTSMLSMSGPWKDWMHERWRPDVLALYPIDFFQHARVRTTAIIGGGGATPRLRVVDQSDPSRGIHVSSWTSDTNWYAQTSIDASTTAAEGLDGPSLGSCFSIAAGCTTGDAYKLKPLVVDEKHGAGRKLVTTGSIDRYMLKWGTQRTRYLKSDYQFPRWPQRASEKSVARAHDRQGGPKIIVAGYTLVIESWCDTSGEAAGIVQTWIMSSPGPTMAEQVPLLYALTAVLNSASFSYEFVRRHGSNAMTGDYIVVKKESLKQMPVPRILREPKMFVSVSPAAAIGMSQDKWHDSASHPLVAALLSRICLVMQRTASSAEVWQQLDKLGHALAASLYGKPSASWEDEYRWWCSRTGTECCNVDYPQLLTAALALLDQNVFETELKRVYIQDLESGQ